MTASDETPASKVEAIKTGYELWANESVVKTEKLTLFFIAQSVLVTGFVFGVWAGQVLISIIGMAFSYISFVSIGRTDAYQIVWKRRIEHLLEDVPEPYRDDFDLYPTDEDMKQLAWYKQISQEYIHYPPVVGFFLWLFLFLIVIFDAMIGLSILRA